MSKKVTVNAFAGKKVVPVGCGISGGILRPTLAPVGYEGVVPEGIIFAGYADVASRFFVCTEENAYVSGNGRHFTQLYPLKGNRPFLVEDVYGGTARAVLVSGSRGVAHTGRTFVGFSFGADLRCGVMHCGRLFGADFEDGLLIRWSGEGGIRDWDEGLYAGGSVKLSPERGEVLNIAEYKEKLVLIRKSGLTVFSAYGMPENFAVELTDTDWSEIYKDTAAVVGDKLFFCSQSGLCYFDGSVIKKVGHRLERDIYSPVFAIPAGDKYYLNCYSKSLGRKVIMCYCPDDGESWLIDVEADAMCFADCLYVYNSGGVFRLEQCTDYTLICTGLDFGSAGKKTVTQICVGGEEVELSIDNGTLSRTFSGAGGVVRPRLRGKSFTVKVKGGKPLNCLSVTAEVCGEI